MQITKYLIEADLEYVEGSIDKFLILAENTFNSMTTDENVRFKLKTAIHELVTNSLEHGYKKQPGKISLSIWRSSKSIFLEIADEGIGIDPSTLNLNKVVESLDTATNRGWGLTLSNQLAKKLVITKNNPKGTIIYLEI